MLPWLPSFPEDETINTYQDILVLTIIYFIYILHYFLSSLEQHSSNYFFLLKISIPVFRNISLTFHLYSQTDGLISFIFSSLFSVDGWPVTTKLPFFQLLSIVILKQLSNPAFKRISSQFLALHFQLSVCISSLNHYSTSNLFNLHIMIFRTHFYLCSQFIVLPQHSFKGLSKCPSPPQIYPPCPLKCMHPQDTAFSFTWLELVLLP